MEEGTTHRISNASYLRGLARIRPGVWKLNFSDEARKLARLLISRARLFFILVQKMDGKKELG